MLVWVFADNASRHFYENIGGQAVDSVMVDVGRAELKLAAYGWKNLNDIPL